MFTGIITDIGRVRAVKDAPGADRRVEILTGFDLAAVPLGASIACSGVCLTVVDKGEEGGTGWFAAEVSNETKGLTTAGRWEQGALINLERPLRVGEELGGHIVQGHVDGLGTVDDIKAEDGSHRMRITFPKALAGLVAPKGSIAMDGVSLTVNEVDAEGFGVNIIPHTWTHTAFHMLKPGASVNLEVDVLARYVARLKEVG